MTKRLPKPPTELLRAARLVSRNQQVAGLQFTLERNVPIRFVPSDDDSLRHVLRDALAGIAPEFIDSLQGEDFDELVREKRRSIEEFWARRQQPVVNERMVRPFAVALS